jgi:hypothetical protein
MKLKDLIGQSKKQIKEFHDLDVEKEWSAFKSKLSPEDQIKLTSKNKIKSLWPRLAQLAAALVGIIVLVYFFRPNKVSTETVNTLVESKTITLQDGSVVKLESHSELTYPVHFRKQNSRNLFLKGQGRFEVATDPAKPFHVYCKDILVKATGTVFSVTETDSSIIIENIEGLVSAEIPGQAGSNVQIPPGQKYEYKNGVFAMLQPKLDTVVTLETLPLKIEKSKPTKLIEVKQVASNTYLLEDLLPYLERQYPEEFKLVKRTKYQKNLHIKTNLLMGMDYVIKSITEQSDLKSRAGECAGCVEIYKN